MGIDARIVFHEGGYRGGAASLAENFENGHYVGVPMLQWFGMTRERGAEGAALYPHMERWLR